MAETRMSEDQVERVTAAERVELARRVRRYRGDHRPLDVTSTARAAIEALRQRGARRIVLAVPVGPEDTVEEMRRVAEEVVVLDTPAWFMAIGEHYLRFDQTTDEEVISLLAEAAGRSASDGEATEVVDPAPAGSRPRGGR